MAFRLPGYPIQEYPNTNNEKLNAVFQILAKHPDSIEGLHKIFEYLGWELNDLEQRKVKYLLDNSEHLEVISFGNLGHNGYKLKPLTYLEIMNHGSFLNWQNSLQIEKENLYAIPINPPIYAKDLRDLAIELAHRKNQLGLNDSPLVERLPVENSITHTKAADRPTVIKKAAKSLWSFINANIVSSILGGLIVALIVYLITR